MVKREEFVKKVIGKMKEKLLQVLPEEDTLDDMYKAFENFLEDEYIDRKKGR